MDVTKAINQIHNQYGGGGNSIASTLSANRSLNFAEGASIQKPVVTGTITRLPFTLKFKGTVGSFGADNQFFEINTSIQDYGREEVYEDGWAVALVSEYTDTDPYYVPGLVNQRNDNEIVNTYYPGIITDNLFGITKPVFTLEMKNKGTGNMYEDAWLDVRLYTKAKEEHPYDGMILQADDKLYVGFHARNTRRLSYDVEIVIGESFTNEYRLTAEQRQLMQKVRSQATI